MKLRVIILLAMVGSAACHRSPGGAPVAPAAPKAGVQTAAPNQHGPNPEQLTAGMVEAVTQGKAQAPINLKFDLLQRPVQGQPLDVAIALLPQVAAGSAKITVSASDGMKFEPGDFEFPAVEAAQVYRHSIQVTAATDGLYLLTLSVTLQHDQTADTRVFSVPILVGSAGTAVASPAGAPAGTAPQQSAGHRGS